MDLSRPRVIADATGIPRLGRGDQVFLVAPSSFDPSEAERAGARRVGRHWTVPRAASVDLDRLEPWLPRYARRSVVPEKVDLIPESSWCASLANMLVPSSWKVLREVTAMRAGNGCEECGQPAGLECHETWRYDEDACVQTLLGMKALCGLCHETRHLGFASVRGRYPQAIARLSLLNRLEPHEERGFADEVFDDFERRSLMEWRLDLSLLSGHEMRLKRVFEAVGTGVVVGRSGRRPVEAVLLGVEAQETAKGVVLV